MGDGELQLVALVGRRGWLAQEFAEGGAKPRSAHGGASWPMAQGGSRSHEKDNHGKQLANRFDRFDQG